MIIFCISSWNDSLFKKAFNSPLIELDIHVPDFIFWSQVVLWK